MKNKEAMFDSIDWVFYDIYEEFYFESAISTSLICA